MKFVLCVNHRAVACTMSYMLVGRHQKYYNEIFPIPGFLRDPILTFGFQDIDVDVDLDAGKSKDLGQYFDRLGLQNVSLDFFDPRSELRYDMNLAVPSDEHERYGCLIDIGSLEHVFDTRQCLENCLRMIQVGGHYMLHTPVNGYFAHGFHTLSPDCLRGALGENGFQVIYTKYSDFHGKELSDPSHGDVLAWIVARKERSLGRFVCPQQSKWFNRYK